MNLELSAGHMYVVKEKLREMGIVNEFVEWTNHLIFSRYKKQGMKDIRETTYEFHGIEWCLRVGMFNGKKIYCTDVYTPRIENHAQSVKTDREEK